MYHMKNIISCEDQIELPKCMYKIKNSMRIENVDDMEINISDQKKKYLGIQYTKIFQKSSNPIMELEERQDKLLLKLDTLYERIKSISLLCKANTNSQTKLNFKEEQSTDLKPQEIVLILNPDALPWFLNIFIKGYKDINMSWHIHSTVNSEKIPKIENFFKKILSLNKQNNDGKINLRLIFKNVSAAPELRLSSLDIPIIGTVNIIRYMCLTFKNIVPYDFTNHNLENLLDLCFLLERATEKNKENIISKIFSNSKVWIHNNEFTIVDLAVYNEIKHLHNSVKCVPKDWYNNCEKRIL